MGESNKEKIFANIIKHLSENNILKEESIHSLSKSIASNKVDRYAWENIIEKEVEGDQDAKSK